MSTDSIGFGLEGVQFTDHPTPEPLVIGRINFGIDPGQGQDFTVVERRILSMPLDAPVVKDMGTVTARLPAKTVTYLTQDQLDQIAEYFGLTPWQPKRSEWCT